MKERTKPSLHQSSKSCFLEKFSGKLNVITKHGQIKDESSFKLPVINSPQSKRSNTMKFRTSKQSMYSFFSEGRSVTSKSSIQKSRVDKFLAPDSNRDFVDISNHFLKNSLNTNLKKSTIKPNRIEPLSALPLTKKFSGSRQPKNRIEQQNIPIERGHNHNNKDYDYESFLNQLHSVSHVLKNKKGQSHIQRNDYTNFNN